MGATEAVRTKSPALSIAVPHDHPAATMPANADSAYVPSADFQCAAARAPPALAATAATTATAATAASLCLENDGTRTTP